MNGHDHLIQLIEEAGRLHMRMLGRPGTTSDKYWRVVERVHARYQRRVGHLLSVELD